MGGILKLLLIILIFLWVLSFFTSEEGQENIDNISGGAQEIGQDLKNKFANFFN